VKFELEPIGWVESPYADLATTPLQSRLNPAARGRIRVLPDLVAGLEGLDGFDFAHLITMLHVTEGQVELRPTPMLLRGTDRRIGLFATRFPRRPNSIGLSVIRILSVADDLIQFEGVDLVDGTPVLDIKPWLPAFDMPDFTELASIRIGWYSGIDLDVHRNRQAVRWRPGKWN
jgi:tRNA-Thr(GGU) m(6)t(6)A37 methyltransferase TsaA